MLSFEVYRVSFDVGGAAHPDGLTALAFGNRLCFEFLKFSFARQTSEFLVGSFEFGILECEF